MKRPTPSPKFISLLCLVVLNFLIVSIWHVTELAEAHRWIMITASIISAFFCFALYKLMLAKQFASLQEKKISDIVETSNDMFCDLDDKLKIRRANNNLLETFGYSREELNYGIDITRLFAKNERFSARKLLAKLFDHAESQIEIFDMQKADGTNFPCEIKITPHFSPKQELLCFHCILRDISAMQRAEQHIEYLTHYNEVTDLPNLALLKDRLGQAIIKAKRAESSVALLLIDIVRFKLIKDSLGYAGTDILLKAIANRLAEHIRQEDTLAHINNDEFAIILPHASSEESAAHGAMIVARKLLNNLLEPFVVNGREIFISGSIGIALYPNDAQAAEELLQKADAAKYHAKVQGKNTHQFYKESFNIASQERIDIEKKLRYALKNNEFDLSYQPVIDTKTDHFTHAEVFLSWNEPTKGILHPEAFLSFAEESGLIVPIGVWVRKNVIEQVSQWQDKEIELPIIHINISTRELQEQDFIYQLESQFNNAKVSPEQFAFDIREDVLFKFDKKMETTLNRIKNLGIELYLDDFGSGYSSINIVKSFPINGLKLDSRAVTNILKNKRMQDLIAGIVAFAHHQNLTVTAEEIESTELYDLLKKLGVDYAQGYIFATPQDPNAFLQFIK